MQDKTHNRITFAGLTLDLARGRLMDGSADVALRPKAFALLCHMASHPNRVLSKDALMAALWPDVIVTEDSLTHCVHEVRRALGPGRAHLLRTVPRRGYLFVPGEAAPPFSAPLRPDLRDDHGEPGAADAGQAAPTLRHDGLVVLPFALGPGAGRQDGPLLDGLVHDVISHLARLRNVHVIARGSAFALRHLAADPVAAGRLLGVAYVLTGTAETRGADILLRVDLVATEGGSVLWTEEIAERRCDFAAVVGRLTTRIAQQVNSELTAAEMRRAIGSGSRPLDAWQTYHVGLHEAFRFTLNRLPVALAHFQRSVALDPGFARAHAAASFCHFLRAFIEHGDDRPAQIEATLRTARDAMQLDDANPSSQWAYGRALWLGGDSAGGLHHLRRAIDLSPGYALAHYFSGLIEALHGDPKTALTHLQTSADLSPFDPFAPSVEVMRAMAFVRTGDLAQAARHAERAARHSNAHEQILAPAALILAEAGQTQAATRIVARLRGLSPGYRVSQLEKTMYDMPGDLAALFRRNAAVLGL